MTKYIDVNAFKEHEEEIIEGLPDGKLKLAAWGLLNDVQNFERADIVCPHCGKGIYECEGNDS